MAIIYPVTGRQIGKISENYFLVLETSGRFTLENRSIAAEPANLAEEYLRVHSSSRRELNTAALSFRLPIDVVNGDLVGAIYRVKPLDEKEKQQFMQELERIVKDATSIP